MVSIFFIIKTLIFSIILIILRGTMPRYRIDRFMLAVWKEWNFYILLLFTSTQTIIMFFFL